MRTLLRSLAIVSALALPVVAHATSISASVSLTDVQNSSNYTFAIITPTVTSITLQPLPYTDPLTIQANSTSSSTTTLTGTDTLTLNFTFTAPGSGGGNISGTGSMTGTVNNTDGTVTWNSTSTSVTLSDGTTVDVAIANAIMDFGTAQQTTNIGGNGSATKVEDDLTFTLGSTAVTPEPSSLALFGTGALGIAALMGRRLKRN